MVQRRNKVNKEERLPRRDAIIRYRKEIEEMVRKIRRWMTETDLPPSDTSVREHTEDVFFGAELSRKAEIYEMKYIISAVYERFPMDSFQKWRNRHQGKRTGLSAR